MSKIFEKLIYLLIRTEHIYIRIFKQKYKSSFERLQIIKNEP